MNKKRMLILLVMITSTLLASCASYKFEPVKNIQVEEFTHINQNNEEVTLETLKGKPWLAMFIFTNCNSICPPMTYNMTEVQQALIEHKIEDYNIVAFSIDPLVDSPEILTQYLSAYSIPDISKWQLLTGYKQEYIEQFAKRSFNSTVKNDPKSDQVIHMSSFYLANAAGTVVKDYNGATDVPIDTIVADLKALTK